MASSLYAPTAASRAAPRVRARVAARAARNSRAAAFFTETSVLYTSADLKEDVAPDPAFRAAGGEEGTVAATSESNREDPRRAARARSLVDIAGDGDDATTDFHDTVVLERGASATSAPWVPFSPSGSACFEVALDVRDGLASVGVDFAPGPDGRPRVAAVSETGAAFGEVKVGDVLLETSELVMIETTEAPSDPANGVGDLSRRFAPQRRWRDSKDASFDECLAAMRSNVSFASAGRGEGADYQPRVLSLRLCRDYVSENAIPMRGEADVRWVDHDGSMEWNEEAIVSGKEWAARHAAGGF